MRTIADRAPATSHRPAGVLLLPLRGDHHSLELTGRDAYECSFDRDGDVARATRKCADQERQINRHGLLRASALEALSISMSVLAVTALTRQAILAVVFQRFIRNGTPRRDRELSVRLHGSTVPLNPAGRLSHGCV